MPLKLSILIPTLEKRRIMYQMLVSDLKSQIAACRASKKIEIITFLDDGQKTVGEKRQWLLDQVISPYFSYVDDDDRLSYHYIQTILEGIKSEPDCVQLQGIITWDKRDSQKFIHSIEYKHYFEDKRVFYRPPNHLNTIRTDLVKDIKFVSSNFGEDTKWAMTIAEQNRLKTMTPIKEPIYYYDYVSNK